MSLVTSYLLNLGKRAVTGGEIHQAEIVNAPKIIDRVYGDGDGVLEFSDVADAAVEIGGEILDKAGSVISFIGSIF